MAFLSLNIWNVGKDSEGEEVGSSGSGTSLYRSEFTTERESGQLGLFIVNAACNVVFFFIAIIT